MGKFYSLAEPFKIPYDGRIRGYGELYEVESVERARRGYWKRVGKEFPQAVMYLEPYESNLKELCEQFPDLAAWVHNTEGHEQLAIGVRGVDRPPWESSPKPEGKPPKLMGLARLVFKVLVEFEDWYLWPDSPHIICVIFREMPHRE